MEEEVVLKLFANCSGGIIMEKMCRYKIGSKGAVHQRVWGLHAVFESILRKMRKL